MKVLTVTDIHQSAAHYRALHAAVERHRPDVVACVGDFLDFGARVGSQLSTMECAASLSALNVEQFVFVRGNHEAEDWLNFVHAWPFQQRSLIALHGTAHVLGPLVIVGFPCDLGWDGLWRETLPQSGNLLTPVGAGRRPLPRNPNRWLKPLWREHGAAFRTLWLLHEPPLKHPLADALNFNREWTDAVERYQPLVTVSGHDHAAPIRNSAWHAKLGKTTCINVGQTVGELRYCVLEFTFAGTTPSLPGHLTVRAFPANQGLEVSLS